jgi:hypothetical protein
MKKKFLKKVNVTDESSAQRNTVSASFKRNKQYADNNPDNRKQLGDALKQQVESVSKQYINGSVDEATHLDNIKSISDDLSSRFGDILIGKRFKIGTAQKALNLYLKFLWCLGKLKAQPPHCPMDAIVLKKASVYDAWTKCDSIDSYKKWVSKAKVKAESKNMTLSEWELGVWSTP